MLRQMASLQILIWRERKGNLMSKGCESEKIKRTVWKIVESSPRVHEVFEIYSSHNWSRVRSTTILLTRVWVFLNTLSCNWKRFSVKTSSQKFFRKSVSWVSFIPQYAYLFDWEGKGRRHITHGRIFRTAQRWMCDSLGCLTNADFKKNDSEDKTKAFAILLKAYQEEVDNLTKRAKYGENAFLNIYQKLYEAPDPLPALVSADVSHLYRFVYIF